MFIKNHLKGNLKNPFISLHYNGCTKIENVMKKPTQRKKGITSKMGNQKEEMGKETNLYEKAVNDQVSSYHPQLVSADSHSLISLGMPFIYNH